MARAKVAISLDESTLDRLDKLVRKQVFPSRSQAIEEAVTEKLQRIERSRLAQECAKLDPAFEKALAEEGPAASRLLLLCDECELSKNGGEYEGQGDCLRGRRGESA
jgi:Arc/MetJ-type ribon-helix-helix transcriptional regulator